MGRGKGRHAGSREALKRLQDTIGWDSNNSTDDHPSHRIMQGFGGFLAGGSNLGSKSGNPQNQGKGRWLELAGL